LLLGKEAYIMQASVVLILKAHRRKTLSTRVFC